MTGPGRSRRGREPDISRSGRAAAQPSVRLRQRPRRAEAERRAIYRLAAWLRRASSHGIAGDASIRLRAALGPIVGATERGQTARLCRLLEDPAAGRLASIDVETNPLCGLIVSTFDGEVGALLSLVAREEADVDVRTEALAALGYLAATARVEVRVVAAFLGLVRDALDPSRAFSLAVCWTMLVAFLGLRELRRSAEALFPIEGAAPYAIASTCLEAEYGEAASSLGATQRFEAAGFGPLRTIDPDDERNRPWARA